MSSRIKDKKIEVFVRQVRDFVSVYGKEYISEIKLEFDLSDPGDPKAEISMCFYDEHWYCVPIAVNKDGDAAIYLGDAACTMHLDGHGLYAYLFHEAHAVRRAHEMDQSKPAEKIRGPLVDLAYSSNTEEMKCLKCEMDGLFGITMSSQVFVTAGDDVSCEFDEMIFDGASACECTRCKFRGRVRDFRPTALGWYTAVLMYPDYATDDYGCDVFVQSSQAEDPYKAAKAIQKMASEANAGDIPPEDFRVVTVFAGDVDVELDAINYEGWVNAQENQ